MTPFWIGILNTLAIGAIHSTYQAGKSANGVINVYEFRKVAGVLYLIFIPIALYFSYWLMIDENWWWLGISVVLNIPPIAAITTMLANIIVIPLSLLVAKVIGAKL